MAPPKRPELERFLAKIEVAENGCWIWTGGRLKPSGYGRFYADGKGRIAHRWGYEQLVGRIPEGLTLDHQCHNRDEACLGGPSCIHRACVNPDHLEPATARDNILRGKGYAAQQARATHCHRGHPLGGDNLILDPNGGRHCRECARRRSRAFNQTESRKAYNRSLNASRADYFRQYREKNAQRNSDYQRAYYEKHRDRVLAQQRARKEGDPEGLRARQREYTRRYRARKRAEAEG